MVTAAGHATRIVSFLNEVKTGSVVNGRYLIEEHLGSGGMGSVYTARHLQLGTKLAIKLPLPEFLGDVEAIGRFDREARAAAKISDENVVRILDVGQLESGAPYIVMEFLEGQDAAVYLKEHGRLSIGHAMDVLLQACAAVAAAHAMDIVHRDIKPSNLFLVPRPTGRPLVKVLDFGASKILSADGQASRHVTKTGTILGSPGYVPPEHWFSSKTADKRSDIWALGVVLYELLTGQLPFDEESLPVLATKIAYQPVVPPRQLRDEIPDDLEQVVLRCLEKKPADRFQDVLTLAQALESCQRRYSTSGRSSVNQPIQVSKTAAAAVAAVKRWRRSLPFSNRAAAAALVGLLVMVGIGAFIHNRGSVAAGQRANLAVRTSHPTPLLVPLVFAAPTESPLISLPVARPKVVPPEGYSPRPAVGHARMASEGQRPPEGGAGTNAARCNPPYYFKPKGIRVFKVECL